MNIEQKINYQLNKYPPLKKVLKRIYQRVAVAVSPKIKSEGNITRLSPADPAHEYFFGYYDKSPWDAGDRYVLCLRANHTWQNVCPPETADIILIDTQKEFADSGRVIKLAETRTWNVQQGCMVQWLGPDFSSKIIYNDLRNGNYVSVILDIHTRKERVLERPVYTVSADGKTALSLDFSRLYNLRPGYGYYNLPEETKGVPLPASTAGESASKSSISNPCVFRVSSTSPGYSAAPVITGMGSISWVFTMILPPLRRYPAYRAASSFSKLMM